MSESFRMDRDTDRASRRGCAAARVILEKHLAAQMDGWQTMDTAPTDGTLIRVLCPGDYELPPLDCPCAYHPDAGFCVDELRQPLLWKAADGSPR